MSCFLDSCESRLYAALFDFSFSTYLECFWTILAYSSASISSTMQFHLYKANKCKAGVTHQQSSFILTAADISDTFYSFNINNDQALLWVLLCHRDS